jgi:hypothetical protein
MPADNTFITAATIATSKELPIMSGDSRVVRISADALVSAEVVDIQVWMGAAFVSSGEELTATAPSKILDGPGLYNLAKGTTASPCAVFLDQ